LLDIAAAHGRCKGRRGGRRVGVDEHDGTGFQAEDGVLGRSDERVSLGDGRPEI
jgi:hypothetical protein